MKKIYYVILSFFLIIPLFAPMSVEAKAPIHIDRFFDLEPETNPRDPEEPGETPEEPGETPEEPEETPEEPGETPEEPGETPEEPGETPEEPGETPEEPNETPEEPEEKPEEPEEPVELSSETRLSDLTIDVGTLSPEFSSDVYEYTIDDVTSEVTELYIDATAWSDDASVYGDGTVEIQAGPNVIEIEVIAEDGTVRIYTLTVNVQEVPEIFVTYDGKKIGVLNYIEETKILEGFELKTMMFQEKEVSCLVSTDGKYTLLYMQDEQKHTGYYLYSEEKGVYSGYYSIKINSEDMIALDVLEDEKEKNGLTYSKIKVGKAEVDGWIFNDTKLGNYALLKLMDENGKVSLFVYDDNKKTIVPYPSTQPVTYDDFQEWLGTKEETPVLLYGGAAVGAVVVFLIIGGIVRFNKNKKMKKTQKYETFSIIDDIKVLDGEIPLNPTTNEEALFAFTQEDKESLQNEEENFWLNDDMFDSIFDKKED